MILLIVSHISAFIAGFIIGDILLTNKILKIVDQIKEEKLSNESE